MFALLIELFLIIYFSFVSLYMAALSLAGLFKRRYRLTGNPVSQRIAVLIPAYKEDAVIIDSLVENLKQDYPSDKFTLVVIADSLQEQTLVKLAATPAIVVKVQFAESTKVKALNAAFQHLGDGYDLAVVLDADNTMAPHFLPVINQYFNSGYPAIQGQRQPKNTDTKMAFLDGLSEAINNHLVRKGTCNLGGSSAIVGSGFAVEYALMKEVLADIDAVGGFDKELEIKLLKRGIKTVYAEEAIVYDEKVASQEVFKKQRTRWIASQFFYLRKYAKESFWALCKGEFALFNSAFLRYAQLPRFLNLGFFLLVLVGILFFREWLTFPYELYLALFVLFLGSLLLSIPRNYYSLKLVKAALELPLTFFNMFLLLFKLKGANRRFIHTPHGKNTGTT